MPEPRRPNAPASAQGIGGHRWAFVTPYRVVSKTFLADIESTNRARLSVFELMSEGDRIGSKKYNLKMQAYSDNKLPLVVVLDPKERRTLTSRDGQPFVEAFELALDLGSRMPGWILDVGAVFAAADRRRKRIRHST